jgi:hypothetical protein
MTAFLCFVANVVAVTRLQVVVASGLALRTVRVVSGLAWLTLSTPELLSPSRDWRSPLSKRRERKFFQISGRP